MFPFDDVIMILDTRSTEYTYMFNAFRWFSIMAIMRLCRDQINEYDIRVIIYPIICRHHRLHNSNEYKTALCTHIRIHITNWQNIMMVQSPHPHNHGTNMTTMKKADNPGLTIPLKWITNIYFRTSKMGQFEAYNAIYYQEEWKGKRENYSETCIKRPLNCVVSQCRWSSMKD